MTLWLVFLLMTAVAIFAVLWPLSRRAPLKAGSDIAVYRDQLDEIERDRNAGLIGDREAESARTEVSRRLIAAAADHARQEGATIIEAYPVDDDAPSYHFMGFVSTFEKAGFTEVARAGIRRHAMRLPLR